MIDQNENTGIGTNSSVNSAVQLQVKAANDRMAITTYTYYTAQYGYGLRLRADGSTAAIANTTKVIAVADKNDVENFLVWGDGYVHAREIKVTQGTFAHPDYVFSRDYKLMSIDNLETYLEKNKHLPGIPSAEQVKKGGGINLGEMTEKHLEKTEELYLYLIELNKKIEKLQIENQELKSHIKKFEQK